MKALLSLAFPLLLAAGFQSCMKDDDEDSFKNWREENVSYFNELKSQEKDGKKVYTELIPDWQPANSILIRWHNDPAKNPNKISPLLNSTVDVIYEGFLKDGSSFGNSFKLTANGDSIFRTSPMQNIPGFAFAVCNMHVGDSVTVVIPYELGYGNVENNSIKPYSTLIYGLKLVGIPAYERPNAQ